MSSTMSPCPWLCFHVFGLVHIFFHVHFHIHVYFYVNLLQTESVTKRRTATSVCLLQQKRKRLTSICFLKRKRKWKFIFLGRQTITSNRRFLNVCLLTIHIINIHCILYLSHIVHAVNLVECRWLT
jgi:hypothetical protein